eukprot:TRINITY_DN2034_c0_g2_i1.p1 TRINITY_DN2034_c0_g2~~TRINITY_DN2034_c0_g2_i1.p1  ORF type:complete len:337 (-),score=68.42 TRINITY_DN2034_c0_g2_i1:155-1165(-)
MESKGRRYILTKKLGEGSFGEAFQGIDLKTKEEIAVKLEKRGSRFPQLHYESKLYAYLHEDAAAWENGIPRVYYRVEDDEHHVLVMELLGPSLEDLFSRAGRRFSLATTVLLGEQMLARVTYLHSRRFIHRDLKPDNFLIGRGRRATRVFLIDFGLSKKYIGRDGVHIPSREGKSLTGTARYASLNTHLGYEQSRRDDIESIAYIMAYFLRGVLPWQNLKVRDKEAKYRMIREKKRSITPDELFKGFPVEFAQFLTYARALRFEDKPDYDFLRGLILRVKEREQIADDAFDWLTPSATGNTKITKQIPPGETQKEEEEEKVRITSNQNMEAGNYKI